MTRVRVRGFQIFTDRHGRPRCYHRATRTAVDLARAPIGSAEFFAECARIAALTQNAPTPKAGTLAGLIRAYRGSTEFGDLAPRTKADYLALCDYLAPIGDTALSKFTRPLVVKIRDKAADKLGRRRGSYVKTVLSILFAWGAERGLMADNPAAGIRDIRRDKARPKANRPWTDAERDAVLTAAEPRLRAALALMAFTGIDPGDAVRLRRDQIKGGSLLIDRAKTGQAVAVPLAALAGLRAALDAMPPHDAVTVLASASGKPWTVSGLQTAWHRLKVRLIEADQIGDGLTLKGLRHTVATILREAGADERTIADVLGQKTDAMARHYSNRANLSKKNAATMVTLADEIERRTKVVKPDPENCQTGTEGE